MNPVATKGVPLRAESQTRVDMNRSTWWAHLAKYDWSDEKGKCRVSRPEKQYHRFSQKPDWNQSHGMGWTASRLAAASHENHLRSAPRCEVTFASWHPCISWGYCGFLQFFCFNPRSQKKQKNTAFPMVFPTVQVSSDNEPEILTNVFMNPLSVSRKLRNLWIDISLYVINHYIII